MSFRSIYSHGFARVAACVTVSHVANPTANAAEILEADMRSADRHLLVVCLVIG